MNEKSNQKEWTLIVKPKSKLLELHLGDIWRYRDLIIVFVRRDFVTQYKQTILGPTILFIQPVFSALVYSLIFGRIARIGTDGAPPIIFYLSTVTLWSYFIDSFSRTSNTLVGNAYLFGKIYFPRLVVPISNILSSFVKLGIQLLVFTVVWLSFVFFTDKLQPHFEMIFLFPFLLLVIAMLGMAMGTFVSSITTKYKDISYLIGFFMQFLMYACPVVYPLSIVPEKYRLFILCNPMTPLLEAFKYTFIGGGFFSWAWLLYSFLFAFVFLLASVILFNRVEKSFMDTV